MTIELKEITIGALAEGYADNAENGVTAYGGRFDVRPPYQREFVYNDKQRDAVIDSVVQGFPLNVMYWALRDDGTYEVIDGQQRTISVCQYVNGDFDHEKRYFHNLQDDEKSAILNYRLNIYVCSGTDSEKLNWFRRINIAGEKLTEQELRNAVYAGAWLMDAKRYFSKSGCAAVAIAGDYCAGSAIRQELLETAIDWISGGDIEKYMARHQHDKNASPLWAYFQQVISWVDSTFPVKRVKYMKGVPWGGLYNEHKNDTLDTDALEKRISQLLIDDDVTNKKGVYSYVLTGDERHLSLRAFSDAMKIAAYERQKGVCKSCGKKFPFEEMEADHIKPWSKGGKTTAENCQMLCRDCNRKKGGK